MVLDSVILHFAYQHQPEYNNMKTTLIIIALAASNASAQIIVGTNSFDIVFEATNLTSVTQSRIVSDINLC